MNKKGAGIMLSIVIGIFVFMAGVLFIQHLASNVVSARVGLECTSINTISWGNKATCLVVDIAVPYFILIVVSVSGGWITRFL